MGKSKSGFYEPKPRSKDSSDRKGKQKREEKDREKRRKEREKRRLLKKEEGYEAIGRSPKGGGCGGTVGSPEREHERDREEAKNWERQKRVEKREMRRDKERQEGRAKDWQAVPLQQCFVRWSEQNLPVARHPYVVALRNDSPETYYESIRGHSGQLRKPSASWEGFRKLVRTLRRGFDPQADPIQVVWTDGIFVCTHGRHRMCILYYLYGGDIILHLGGKYVQAITSSQMHRKSSKNFQSVGL